MQAPLRILAIEDMTTDFELITWELKKAGILFQIERVETKEAFLKALTHFNPQIILSDYNLPQFNAMEALSLLKQETNNIPFILITGTQSEEVAVTCMKAGMADYILKGSLKRLPSALLSALEKNEIENKRIQAEKALRESEGILRRKTEELELSNRELDDFAYVASHDLKEPLRGIANYAHFLWEDYADKFDEEGQKKLKILVDLPKHMEMVINNLLTFSLVGRAHLMLQNVNLNKLLEEVLILLKPIIEEKQIQIRLPRLLPTITCDWGRMREVFLNLIINAIKYNDKPEKWIEIGYQENPVVPDQPIVFYIQDNGIGIQEKHREVIFRIFKRLHSQKSYGGGTGVGLTIVKKIIDRHQGKIWVESTPGKGTTFYFVVSPVKEEKM